MSCIRLPGVPTPLYVSGTFVYKVELLYELIAILSVTSRCTLREGPRLSVTSLPLQSSRCTLCGMVWPEVNVFTICGVPGKLSAPSGVKLSSILSSFSGGSKMTRKCARTVTVKVQVLLLPQESVAVTVIVWAPGPIRDPEAGEQVTVTRP